MQWTRRYHILPLGRALVGSYDIAVRKSGSKSVGMSDQRMMFSKLFKQASNQKQVQRNMLNKKKEKTSHKSSSANMMSSQVTLNSAMESIESRDIDFLEGRQFKIYI